MLETCPRVFSLGYLVFAAAGLKQVFGYEERAETRFTEIFYRGPSDQKLSTIGSFRSLNIFSHIQIHQSIDVFCLLDKDLFYPFASSKIQCLLFVSANCCPNLETMFLGSNNPRSLNPGVFRHWPRLAFLTLENIMVENIVHCLEEVGSQLKGLKIQCSGFDLSDIAVLCPNLKSLIIQKEAPNPGGGYINNFFKSNNAFSRSVINPVRSSKTRLFAGLEHVEVSCPQFSKHCFGFILKNAVNLVSIKVNRNFWL